MGEVTGKLIVTPTRRSLLGIIGGLMAAENMGDVHDEIGLLHELVGLPKPEGDFQSGWTDQDWCNVIGTRGRWVK